MINFTNKKPLGESFVQMSITEGGTPSMLTVHHPVGVHQFHDPKGTWIATSSDRIQDLLNEADADLAAFKQWSGRATTQLVVEAGFARQGPYGPKVEQVYYTGKCPEGVNLLEVFPHVKEINPNVTEPGSGDANALTIQVLTDMLGQHPRYVWLDAGEKHRKEWYHESKEYQDYLAQQHEHDNPKDPRKRVPKPNRPKMPERELFLYSFVNVAEKAYTSCQKQVVNPAQLMSLFVVEQGFATMVRAHQIMQKPIPFLQGMTLEEARMTYASLLLQPHLYTISVKETGSGESGTTPAPPPPGKDERKQIPLPAPPPPPPMPSNMTSPADAPMNATFLGMPIPQRKNNSWGTGGPFTSALAADRTDEGDHQEESDGLGLDGEDASGYDPVLPYRN